MRRVKGRMKDETVKTILNTGETQADIFQELQKEDSYSVSRLS